MLKIKKCVLILVVILGIMVTFYIIKKDNNRVQALCSCTTSCDVSCPLNNNQAGCNCNNTINNKDGASCPTIEEQDC